MEEHILDLGKRAWTYRRFGLTIVGTWVNVDQRWRPCMAVFREDHPEFRPCVIPIDNAWEWSDRIGTPYPRAAAIVLRLGIDPYNPDNVHKLIAMVNDRMHDLVTMPPRPTDAEEHADPVVALTIDSELSGKTEVEL